MRRTAHEQPEARLVGPPAPLDHERLLRALLEAQGEVLRGGDTHGPLQTLLAVLLELTGSEQGFIIEVHPSPEGAPALQVIASTPPGGWAHSDLHALLSTALSTGQPVCELPPGLQPQRSFLGLALETRGERVGLLGLANRPGGYGAELIDFLQPVRSAGGDILLGGRQVAQRRRAGQELSRLEEGRRGALSATQRSEERWRALVQAIPDLIFRIRIDGTYLDFKYTGTEELVTSPERIIGTNIRDHALPEWIIEQGFLHLERAIRQGSLEVYEYELEMPRGRQYYEWRIVRSGPDEAVCIIRDITERKLAEARLLQQEEELRRHRDSLEVLVESRTQKLLQATRELEVQQAQLIQSEKMASLGQMAAGIVHEINNPVSYVTSNLGTLGEYVSVLTPLLALQRELLALHASQLQGPGAELLARMRDLWAQGDVDFILEDLPEMLHESRGGTRRIQEIIQSLRSFAREDSGEPQSVDVNAELESTLKLVWNELKYKCEVKRDFGPLQPVIFHPTQLSQVFTNLLINAAQAIETKGAILIQTRQEGAEVVVRISDTGHGMTQETLSKLFMPFFTTKPRGQGTGLGLSISYGIITRHKGHISVESEPGQGSTFTLRLPAG